MGVNISNHSNTPSPLEGDGNFSTRDTSARKMGEESKRKLVITIILIGLGLIIFQNDAFAKKRKENTPYQEYLYQQKVLRKIEKEKYKARLLPESGFQTVEEYEIKSRSIPNAEKKVPEAKLPKDIKMQYVPQPTYTLAKYNNPPGTAELRIERRFYFDRQQNAQGIVSPDKSFMVYPSVYYYAASQCTSADLFVVQLDKTLPDVDRISRANVVRRDPNPILSTDKAIDQQYVFRTMTPVDFSADGRILIAKEKIGYNYDGIWKTNLWVYDFSTKHAKCLPEIRDAIKFYWLNTDGTVLDEKRWDIYPLGFDLNDPYRIVVAAYGYTGKVPKFLGTWSIDPQGERTQLVSLFNDQPEISINGFKLVKSGVVKPAELQVEAKQVNKAIKKKRKEAKHAKKQAKKELKKELHKTLHEMKREVSHNKTLYQEHKRVHAPSGLE